MAPKLNDIRRLLKVLYQYQTVERAYPTPYGTRLENDVEHSYVLAMLAWFIIEEEHLPLDHGKVLKYCLAHDLVEVYAGDTWTVGKQKPGHSVRTKDARENRAQERLKKELPFFEELHRSIDGYKNRIDPESTFVYALDKVISNLVVSLHADKGKKLFKKIGATLEMLHESKKGKVSLHPTTEVLWEELTNLLRRYDKKHKIFPKITEARTTSRRKRKR